MIGPGSDKNLFFGVSRIKCCGSVVMYQVARSRGQFGFRKHGSAIFLFLTWIWHMQLSSILAHVVARLFWATPSSLPLPHPPKMQRHLPGNLTLSSFALTCWITLLFSWSGDLPKLSPLRVGEEPAGAKIRNFCTAAAAAEEEAASRRKAGGNDAR